MGTVTDLRPKPSGAVKLKPGAELGYDQAAGFLLDLPARVKGADLPTAMYLLGLAEGHLADMVQLARALTGATTP